MKRLFTFLMCSFICISHASEYHALIDAIKNNNPDRMQECLNIGAKPNTIHQGFSALDYAVMHDSLQCAQYLLEQKAKPYQLAVIKSIEMYDLFAKRNHPIPYSLSAIVVRIIEIRKPNQPFGSKKFPPDYKEKNGSINRFGKQKRLPKP